MHELPYRLRTWMLTSAQRALTRTGAIEHAGIHLDVAPGVHHPAPVLGLGLAALQLAALDVIPPHARVLDLGTGAGFWAIVAARRGFDVTATDLAHVPLDPIRVAAARAGVSLRLLHSDLFGALEGERFDAISFNPPFHDAQPRAIAETAWCGGDVVRRCLAEASEHLRERGALYLLMPQIDRRRYEPELTRWVTRVAASRWYPLLGRTELLVLEPRDAAPR